MEEFKPGQEVWWLKSNSDGNRILRTPAIFVRQTEDRVVIEVEDYMGNKKRKPVKIGTVKKR